jgi:signal transduction histidine kinase/CheY-like chemotaxis protein
MRQLLLIALLFLCSPLWAGTPVLLQGDDVRLDLSAHAFYLQDPTGSLDAQQVGSLPDSAFKPITSKQINMGKNASAWWFRVRLENPGTRALGGFLEINYPLLDDLQLFQLESDGRITRQTASDLLSFDQRPVQLRNFWFPLELAPGQSTLLLRVESSSTLFVPIYFSTWKASVETLEWNSMLNGAFYGLLIGMFFYNLFLFIYVREQVYFWYLLHSVSMGLLAASMDGLLFMLLPTWLGVQAYGVYVLMLVTGTTATQFARHFLHTAEHFPRLDMALKSLVLITLFAMLMEPLIGVQGWGTLTSLMLMSVSALLLLAGIYVWRQGMRYGTFYMIGWSVLLISLILVTLGSLGLSPFGFRIEMVKLGSAFELVLLSVGLADRINALKDERFKAEQSASHALIESHAKTRFMAKMSHEIRTPLNGVVGMLQLLRDTGLDRAQKSYLDTVLSSSDALLSVINNLIDYSRLEAGKVALEQIEFDLEQLLSDALNLFTAQALRKNLALHLSLEPGVPRRVNGDPTRLKQVLMNLLGNAVKFTRSGHVSLNAGCFVDTRGIQQLRFCVSDTGIGIDPEKLPKLFESFSQAESSTTRRFGGSGLGLAISRELVELMGGKIEVSSNPGQGSRFSFCVPVPDNTLDADAPVRFKGRLAAIGSIDTQGLDTLELLLQRWGMRVERGHDPQRLREVFAEDRTPALLVLMDPLPGGARKWLQELRSHLGAGQSVLLIGPTDFCDSPESIAPAQLLCLPKPLTVSTLRSALEDLAAGPQAQAPAATAPDEQNNSLPAILLAEDHHVNQLVIQGLLRQRGYRTRLSENGLEALQQYQRNPAEFRLILMDCEMPVLDGLAASREIRQWEAEQGLPAIPIILLTALDLDELRTEARAAGINECLSKPVDAELLQQTLQRYLATPC